MKKITFHLLVILPFATLLILSPIAHASPKEAALVKDIKAGPNSSFPEELTDVNGTLFFKAASGTSSRRHLWKSNGTKGSTVLVKEFDWDDNHLGYLTQVGDILLFRVDDTIHGAELWRSDGTATGTYMVKDIRSGSLGSAPQHFVCVNDILYFAANDGTHSGELWRSDGTTSGTYIVKDIFSGISTSAPENLTDVNGTLYFSAQDSTHRRELWKSDGTEGGTVLVKDIYPGINDSTPQELTAVGSMLFFTAEDGLNGRELWKSDGTEGGTVLVMDIHGGSVGSDPDNITQLGFAVIFSATDNWFYGREPWISYLGITTEILKNINYIGSDLLPSSNPDYITTIGSIVYFAATTSDGSARELWKSNGNTSGTVMVKDIYPGNSSSPEELINFEDLLVFTANDGIYGRELWQSDGTDAGTVMIKNIHPSSDSDPDNFTISGNRLYFVADDGEHGRELWVYASPFPWPAFLPAILENSVR